MVGGKPGGADKSDGEFWSIKRETVSLLKELRGFGEVTSTYRKTCLLPKATTFLVTGANSMVVWGGQRARGPREDWAVGKRFEWHVAEPRWIGGRIAGQLAITAVWLWRLMAPQKIDRSWLVHLRAALLSQPLTIVVGCSTNLTSNNTETIVMHSSIEVPLGNYLQMSRLPLLEVPSRSED